MMKFSFQNARGFSLNGTANRADISLVNLMPDEQALADINTLIATKKTDSLKYIVLIGIGGSSLGAQAVYHALFGHCDVLTPRRFPKIVFLDTLDPEFAAAFENFLHAEIQTPDEVLVNVVSKSGITLETTEWFSRVLSLMQDRWERAVERFVITTDEDSPLAVRRDTSGMARLVLPKSVGGRFSVFSAVGLFPLALCGLAVEELLAGAAAMRDKCASDNPNENPAIASAMVLFNAKQKGFVIHDTFLFHPELESLGKWGRQLTAESLGKERNNYGAVVREGITPTVSIGTNDLHSVLQLTIGGPRDKITTFVSTARQEGRFGEVMSAILAGVTKTYQNEELPFTEIVMDDISPQSLGEYMYFKMLETTYLAALLQVNPFDQPSVELYKTEARKNLGQ